MEREHRTFEAKQADGWWIASTRDVDRQMDIVEPRGLLLDNYQKNNVLLWAHDYYSPHAVIGRAEEVEVNDHEVRIRPSWREPASESDPMHIIRSLIDAGLVRALSVGFRPIESMENQFGGRTFTKAELLEISLVPIPAQQNALREQLAYAVKSLYGTEPNPDIGIGDGAGIDISVNATDEGLRINTHELAEKVASILRSHAEGALELADTADVPDELDDSQGQTPEATAATAAADADEALAPDEQAALAETLAAMLAQLTDYLQEHER